jgi:hypothetical protein
MAAPPRAAIERKEYEMSTKSSHSKTDDFSQTEVNTPPPVNGSPVNEAIQPKMLERIRLDQNFTVGQLRRISVAVEVRKPHKQQWIYIYPEAEWRAPVALYEDEENRTTYAVTPEIEPEMLGDVVRKWLVTYGTRHGTTNLWPIKMPDETGWLDQANQSALRIVNDHAGKWIRVVWKKPFYEFIESTIQLPPPERPAGGFGELVAKAFKGLLIDTIDHPVLRRSRGDIL